MTDSLERIKAIRRRMAALSTSYAPSQEEPILSDLEKLKTRVNTYDTFLDNMKSLGFPDPRGKTAMGFFADWMKVPGSKVMSAMYTAPRTFSAVTAKNIELMKQSKSIKDLLSKTGESYKTGAKAFFNRPGEYQDWNWAKTYKKLYPGTKFTKEFKYAGDTDDWIKGTNWLQKITAGLAASPADIAGFATDIATDPLTYLTGGLGRGAKTGIRLTADIVDDAGRVILPKGSMLGLSKTGKILASEAVTKNLPRSLKYLKQPVGTIAKQSPKLAKQLKLLKNIPVEPAQYKFTQSIIERTIRNAAKNMPGNEAMKLFDFGGLKFAGQTVIPGYKFTSTPAKLAKKKGIDSLLGLFYTGKDMPESYRYMNQYIKSSMKGRSAKATKLFAEITKDLSKTSREKIKNYGWIQNSIEQHTSTLLSNPSIEQQKTLINRIIKLQDELAKITLTTEEATAIKRYTGELMPELAKTEKYWQVPPPKTYEKYMPIRRTDVPEGNWLKRAMSDVGPKVSAYELPKKIDYLKAQKMIKEGKLAVGTLEENTLKRIMESSMRTGRGQTMNYAKQWGSVFPQQGMKKISGADAAILPELKGWYMPDDIIKPLKNTKQLFFGDVAFKSTLKHYDKLLTTWKRLALATPGYHMRNLYSDTFSGVMEYGLRFLKPTTWDDAVKIKKAEMYGGKYLDEFLHTAGFGGRKLTAGNVLDEFLDSGVMGGGQYFKEAKTAPGAWSKLQKVSPLEWSTRVGGHREDMGRIVAGLIEKEAGSNKIIIASQVKKVFFDYSDLTPFEQNVARRFVMPFYTWTKKNLLRQIELTMTRTGKYATIPKTLEFIENISEKPEGYDKFKPDYYKELSAILTPFTTMSGVPLVSNPNLPFQDLTGLGSSDIYNRLNPLAKIFFELKQNKDLFLGQPTHTGRAQIAPDYLQPLSKLPAKTLKEIGMFKDTDGVLHITTLASYLLRQIPTAYSAERMFPGEDKVKTPYQRLSTLAGIKFFPYEAEKQEEYYYKDEEQKMQDAIRRLKDMKILPEDYTLTDIKAELGKSIRQWKK